MALHRATFLVVDRLAVADHEEALDRAAVVDLSAVVDREDLLDHGR
jgi:hypothetical protein